MVTFRAFRPLRYDPAMIGDLSAVVAPPYDVISNSHRDALYARSERNVVRLILNREPAPYTAAAETLRSWRRNGVLVRAPEPAQAFYVEDFTVPGGGARRREGIIGVVRLESFASGNIRPHERTFARAREDRLRVLRACRMNLSPIFGLFADDAGVLDLSRTAAATRPPDVDIHDEFYVRHRLWWLTTPALIQHTADKLAVKTVLIADGHHRYETALAYAEERRAQGSADPDAAHNFVLMYLTAMHHPGLVILPTHRVLAAGAPVDSGAFRERLQQHFHLTPFAGSAREAFSASLQDSPEGSFGLTLAGAEQMFVASLADRAVVDQYAAHLAPVVRRLDVTVLDTVVLRGLLGLDCTAAAQDGQLTYTHDDAAALAAVAQGAFAAFLMKPPRIDDVEAVCLAGQTMPEKSTYFYPKLLTGLLFHPLEDDAESTTLGRGGAAAGATSAAS